MPSVTVRNLSSELIDKLRRVARSNNRSMEVQIRLILEEFARDRASLMDQIEREVEQQGRATSQSQVEGWIASSRKSG